MDWVSKVDNQGWPPRPILVTGSSIPGTDLSISQQDESGQTASGNLPPGNRPVSSANDPIALGQALFRTAVPTCAACHSTAPGVNLAGPTLANIVATAEKTMASPDYKGKAKTVDEYIRESLVEPSAYLQPVAMYSANCVSFIHPAYSKDLRRHQVNKQETGKKK